MVVPARHVRYGRIPMPTALFGCWLFLAAASSHGAPDAVAVRWLTKALTGSTVGYSGVQTTIVYSEQGSVESRVRVRGDGRGNSLREFLSGPASGTVLLQTPEGRYQKRSGGGYVHLPTSADGTPSDAAKLIAANYNVTVSPGQSMLGRKVTKISIVPKHPSSPSRVMAVDTSTGLVLEDTLLAPGGQKRSVTSFVELKYGAQPSSVFAAPKPVPATGADLGPGSFAARGSERAVLSETGRAVPRPSYVPAGFRVGTYGVMRTGSGRLTPAVRYTDGLAAFSIFVRGAGQGMGAGMGPRGRGRGPGPHRFGRGPAGSESIGSVSIQSDRQQATVLYTGRTGSYILIGDIAADELANVARSLP